MGCRLRQPGAADRYTCPAKQVELAFRHCRLPRGKGLTSSSTPSFCKKRAKPGTRMSAGHCKHLILLSNYAPLRAVEEVLIVCLVSPTVKRFDTKNHAVTGLSSRAGETILLSR